jgi:hypothetical protein
MSRDLPPWRYGHDAEIEGPVERPTSSTISADQKVFRHLADQ